MRGCETVSALMFDDAQDENDAVANDGCLAEGNHATFNVPFTSTTRSLMFRGGRVAGIRLYLVTMPLSE
jgi:hypothetical protein